ncbi:hypothetical protein EJ05DRAFT_502016 [Pseudovirgaria hyperparasitica]|uniref:Uncharacterized protein n=1 Tax=Pseudovirgaria hyperparasitica TaxID=470096 RepID=A0A6A6W301_9PEZI|nr:uncharacterized protein EJ05DRAFT_502016 [Pseudovirgaria hyperparasitica]KAF2756509.1 hypothetical protein EJ05DRAFT_502016 [Pseudovirgaria hyperparasitica]
MPEVFNFPGLTLTIDAAKVKISYKDPSGDHVSLQWDTATSEAKSYKQGCFELTVRPGGFIEISCVGALGDFTFVFQPSEPIASPPPSTRPPSRHHRTPSKTMSDASDDQPLFVPAAPSTPKTKPKHLRAPSASPMGPPLPQSRGPTPKSTTTAPTARMRTLASSPSGDVSMDTHDPVPRVRTTSAVCSPSAEQDVTSANTARKHLPTLAQHHINERIKGKREREEARERAAAVRARRNM